MDNQIGAISAINLLPSTKEQVKMFSEIVINEVEAGNVNPLDLKAQLKFIEKSIEEINNGIKDLMLKEAAKHGKSFEYKGWKIEEAETGVRYDFSGDLLHSELSKKIKEHEAFLKGLKEPITVVDEETGEIKKVYPPIKKSTTTLKFTAL